MDPLLADVWVTVLSNSSWNITYLDSLSLARLQTSKHPPKWCTDYTAALHPVCIMYVCNGYSMNAPLPLIWHDPPLKPISTKYQAPSSPRPILPLWKHGSCKESPGWNGLHYWSFASHFMLDINTGCWHRHWLPWSRPSPALEIDHLC